MAWNPSPEVAVIRDAAEHLGQLANMTVDRAVIVYTTAEGRFGYCSYGKTRELCADAKRMADRMYRAAEAYLAEEKP